MKQPDMPDQGDTSGNYMSKNCATDQKVISLFSCTTSVLGDRVILASEYWNEATELFNIMYCIGEKVPVASQANGY